MKLFAEVLVFVLSVSLCCCIITSRKRALQPSHEKPQWLKWSEKFMGKVTFDQQGYLVKMLKVITTSFLNDCTPIILYDDFSEINDNLLIEKLLRNFPVPYVHGRISRNYTITLNKAESTLSTCVNYMMFVKDVMKCRSIIGEQSKQKVIIIARSSQWRVFEFLTKEESRSFVNLLVIVKSENFIGSLEEAPYILYTHKLFADALGTSKPVVLTSYQKNEFTRKVNLFPKKMTEGFSGHRFIISVAHQPPFIIAKERNQDNEKSFDGIEIRLVDILAKFYNFSTDYREATDDLVSGSSEAVTKNVEKKKANLGIAGIYITNDKMSRVALSKWHSHDCAAFISLSSTALPKYRAILGPFHWTVWLTLTIIYLLAIFPLTFSDKHTLRPLLNNPEEIENMFWYVFGTFTNCFTFTGTKSWNKSDKLTTRLLVGFYWIFTIIVTACYTGSIIAFITLPPVATVFDSVDQLLRGRFVIGTLDKGEWPSLFLNLSDKRSEKLLKNLELVPNVEAGLKNITKSFFWNYAFLGSREQLNYIIKMNFTTTNKKVSLHVGSECFIPFNVAIEFPQNSIYEEVLNNGIQRIVQAGLIQKFKSDVEWQMMRSANGKFLAANVAGGGLKALSVQDRSLTLDDTQGMFLLLAMGFLVGAALVISEIFGGCFHLCKKKYDRRVSDVSIESNPRVHERQTRRESLNLDGYYLARINKKMDFYSNSKAEEADMISYRHRQKELLKMDAVIHEGEEIEAGSSNSIATHQIE